MNTEQQIQALQAEVRRLSGMVSDLQMQVNKNNFSNLKVYTTPVQFKSINVFPKDDTVINTVTVNSTGRITIKDDTGTTRYIPYF